MTQTNRRVQAVLAELGTRPLVVATLTGATVIEDALTAARHRADLLELRVDTLPAHYGEPTALSALITQLKGAVPLPLIATIRDPDEQDGLPTSSTPAPPPMTAGLRATLFEAALPHVEFVDVELRAESLHRRVIPEAHRQGKGVIVSSHAIHAMPALPELTQTAKQAKAAEADVVKIAAYAQTPGEVVRLLEFCAHSAIRPLAVIALGDVGTASRVAGFLFGSCLTYGFIRQPAARGQLSLVELQDALRLLFPPRAPSGTA